MPFSANFGGFQDFPFGGFGDFQSGNRGSAPPPRRARKPRKAIGNSFTRTLINLAVTLVFALAYFYVELPPLNPHAEAFYVFVFLICLVYCISAAITSGFQGEGAKGYLGFVKKQCTLPFLVFLALIAAIAIGAVSSWDSHAGRGFRSATGHPEAG